jgi:anti-sigma factor RsiW
MNCTRHEMHLLLHAHGQLGPVTRLLVEAHLEGCDRCRAKWARLTVERDSLRRTLSPLPMLEASDRRLMQSVGFGIRLEPREPREGPFAGVSPLTQRILVLVVAAILAIGASALAAFWEPPTRSCRPGAPMQVTPAVSPAPVTPAAAPGRATPAAAPAPVGVPCPLCGKPGYSGNVPACDAPLPALNAPTVLGGDGSGCALDGIKQAR